MIAALTGRLTSKAPSHLIVDVQGVGYEVLVPLSTFYGLPDLSESLHLHIHTHLREDALHLYGFLTIQEKDAFVLLTGVSGIGPKLALSVLSALSVPDLVSAIGSGDVDKLATVPGIGKKSAGRIALELKDKTERLLPTFPVPSASMPGPSGQLQEDALSALVNLGYRSTDVKEVVRRRLVGHQPPPSLQQLVRDALKDLATR